MKKLIGGIGVAVIAMTMFFSTNSKMSNFDVTLNDILSTNEANAEYFPTPNCNICSYSYFYSCVFVHYQTGERVPCPNTMYYG